MMKCYAITIARGLGSDGGEIARRLSQKLNIRFVDKELLQMASDESGINEALFAMTDEKLNRKIMKRSVGAYRGEVYDPGSEDYLTNKNMFEYQGKVLMKMIISDESFVVVGRAANYIFKKSPNVLSVSIWASDNYCIENIMNRNDLSWDEAQKLIKKTNKYRAEYYNYYTGEDWKDPKNYDVCLNSGALGVDNCVDIISSLLKIKLAGKAALP